MSECHACGRCSGYRDAVELATRAPDSEILATWQRQCRPQAEAVTLIFGILGIGTAAICWHGSRWFLMFKTAVAGWLSPDSLPVVANYRARGGCWRTIRKRMWCFRLFDGLCLLLYLLGGGALLGLAIGGLYLAGCADRGGASVCRGNAFRWR